MRKNLNRLQALLLVLLCLFCSCAKDIRLGKYPDPEPSSIYNLRRVQITEDLVWGETAIPGVVTSDIKHGNFDSRVLVIQDLNNEAAVAVALPVANASLNAGDVVVMNLKGASIVERSGELTIINLPLGQLKATGEQRVVVPKPVSIAAVLANAKYWGPLLVKLDKISVYNQESDRLNGDLVIDDEIAEMKVSFNAGSAFEQESNPGYIESLIGIVSKRGSDWSVRPRSLNDIRLGVSEILEDFEQGSNTNYDSKVMTFVTGAWVIDGGITATSTADPKNGKQSIRLQGTVGNANRNGVVAMNFDLKGVKTVSISHGIYPAAAELANINPTVLSVEVSRNGGQTYQLVGTAEIDIQSRSLSTNTFSINAGFNEPVRIRIGNTSQPFANNSRPRINIDDILFKF
jgi:hypothetical protein